MDIRGRLALWPPLLVTTILFLSNSVNAQNCTTPKTGEEIMEGTTDFLTNTCEDICHCYPGGQLACVTAGCTADATCDYGNAASGSQCNCKTGYTGDGFFCLKDPVSLDSYLGCYKKKIPRHFRKNPGGYTSANSHPVACRMRCASSNMNYAAMYYGKYCFCSDTLPDVSYKEADTNCITPCASTVFATMTCGSDTHLSVYRAPLEINSVWITSNAAQDIVELETEISFNVKVTTAANEYSLKLDYGENGGRDGENCTTKKFLKPGEHLVQAVAGDTEGLVAEVNHGIRVLAQAQPEEVTLDCPPVVPSQLEFKCSGTVWQGSTMRTNTDWSEGGTETFNIADPLYSSAGTGVPQEYTEAGFTPVASSKLVVLGDPSFRFQRKGAVTYWEYHAQTAGNIDFMILRPNCPSYCSYDDSCNVGCAIPGQSTCTSGQLFCGPKSSCTSAPISPGTCSGAITSPRTFTVVDSYTASIGSTGWGYVKIPSNSINVQAGDRIGFSTTSTGRISQRSVLPGESSDWVYNTGTLTLNNNAADTWTNSNSRFLLRAIASEPSKLKLYHVYPNPGLYPVTLEAEATLITATAQNTTEILVQDKINVTEIDVPNHYKTNGSCLFALAPHTGTNVTYEWTFDDGDIINTTDITINKAYSSRGIYNVSVRSMNLVDEGSHWKLIIIEDEILDVQVSSDPSIVGASTKFHYSMTSGSDYACYWDWKDASNNDVISWSSPSDIIGADQWHTFPADVIYTVETRCENNISSVTVLTNHTVQYVISDLKNNEEGAERNKHFGLSFSLNGTSPQFNLTFDGATEQLYYDAGTKTAKTAAGVFIKPTTNLYSGIIYAWNLVSLESLTFNFTVDMPITNPQVIHTDLLVILQGRVDFKVTMDEGTSVKVIWSFTDENAVAEYYHGDLVNWNNSQEVSKGHLFDFPGIYPVSVTFMNNYNEINETFLVKVMNKVEGVDLVCDSPVAYINKKGSSFCGLKPIPPAQYPPLFADVDIFIDGEFQNSYKQGDLDTWPGIFPKVKHGPFEFPKLGMYNISANVSNSISWQMLWTEMFVILPITNLGANISTKYPEVGKAVTIMASMFIGEQVTFTIDWGDGTDTDEIARTGTQWFHVDSLSHAYQTSGDYDIEFITKNAVGNITKMFRVKAMHAVTRDFIVTSDAPLEFPAATVTVTISLPDGKIPPDDATISFKYKDSSDWTYPIPLQIGAPPLNTISFQYTYGGPGDYEIQIIIKNDASEEMFSVLGGTYIRLESFEVQTMYKPDFPLDAAMKPGVLGPDGKYKFPPKSQLFFVPTLDKGTVALYTFEVISENGDVMFSVNTTTSPVAIPLDLPPGNYAVKSLVANPLNSETFPFTVGVADGFKAPVITDPGRVKPNEQLNMGVSFDLVDSEGCVVVEWGDGDDGTEAFGVNITKCTHTSKLNGLTDSITKDIPLKHTYKTEGRFTVTVTCYSAFDPVVKTVDIVVSSTDCTNPKIEFKLNGNDGGLLSPIAFEKSRDIYIITETTVTCADPKNTKVWSIFNVDQKSGRTTTQVDIPGLTRSDLKIRSTTVPYGLYQVTYNVTMSVNKLFWTAQSLYVRVIASDLIASLVEGGMSLITKGFHSMITLEPSKYSKDPDLASDDDQAFDSFTYFCRQINEKYTMANGKISTKMMTYPYPHDAIKYSLDNPDQDNSLPELGGCFKQGPSAVARRTPAGEAVLDTRGSLSFSARNMVENDTFEFTLLVEKGERRKETTLEIAITSNEPPELIITCKTLGLCKPATGRIKVTSSADLRVMVECTPACDQLETTWELFYGGPHDSWMKVDNFTDYIKGVSSSEISVQKRFFEDSYYISEFKLQVTSWLKDGTGSVGRSYTIVEVNQPPTAGTCNVSVIEATTPGLRRVICDGFEDDDGIELYKVYALIKGDPNKKQLSFSNTGDFNFSLVQGKAEDDYNMDLYISCFDNMGSVIDMKIGSDRNAPPTAAERAAMLAGADEDIALLAAEGNIEIMTMKFLSYAAAFNTIAGSETSVNFPIAAGKTSTSYGSDTGEASSGDANMSDADRKAALQRYEEGRTKRAELREAMISSLTDANIDSIEGLQVVATTLATLVERPEETTRTSQEKIGGFLEEATQSMSKMIHTVPVSEYVEALKPLLNVIGNVMEAGNHNMHHHMGPDLDTAKLSDKFVFETDLNSGRVWVKTENGLLLDTNTVVQVDTNTKIVNQMRSNIDSLLSPLMNAIVPGEDRLEIVTPKMAATIEKNVAREVTGKTVSIGRSLVTLPQFCSMISDPLCHSASTVVGLTMLAFPSNPYAFMEDTTGKKIASVHSKSEVVSVDFSDVDGAPIQISNSSQAITLEIPRDMTINEVPKPDLLQARMSETNEDQHLFYNKFNVSQEGASLFVEIVPKDPNVQFIAFVRYKEFPKINNSLYDDFMMIPKSMTRKARQSSESEDQFLQRVYTMQTSSINQDGTSKTGQWVVGIRELDKSEHDLYTSDNPPGVPEPFTGRPTSNYTLRTWMCSCSYLDKNTAWSTEGLKCGPNSTILKSDCKTTHLSTFGSGWVVQPNAIDFDYVFANADFFTNMTLYLTEIFVFVFFLIGAIWARRKDIKDIQKRGITPLPDNMPGDHYFYEINVQTGIRKQAATDSKIHVILSGESDETDVRIFEDPKRKVFRRGGMDSFLMAVPRPLGSLTYTRIWHDNSGKGKYGSWYLNYIIITDLQTRQRFYFIANTWFGVDQGDGEVDRLIPIAGPEQMLELKHLVTNKASQRLGDDHLWFSVIARPPESRFTRLQRLSCCLLLLFSTMLANAMFYGTGGDANSASSVNIGPFSFSIQQLYVGFISVLVVFPVNFLVVTLFRKARPRKKSPSRVLDAIKINDEKMEKKRKAEAKQRYNDNDRLLSLESELPGCSGTSNTRPGSALSGPTRSATSCSDYNVFSATKPLQPQLPPTMRDEDDQKLQEQGDKDKEEEEEKKESKPKKKSFSLPWWFRIVAWIILWVSTLTCGAVVTFYGISFGDEKTRQWITSLMISFFTSIFLTQPIKVLLGAVLFSLIFKNSDLVDEVAEADEEMAPLEYDEQYLHPLPGDPDYEPRKRRIAYDPPDRAVLDAARKLREKESKMYDIIREILFYATFLWVLLVVSYGFRNPNAFLLRNNLANNVVDLNKGRYSSDKISLNEVLSTSDYWNWLERTMGIMLRADKWYNGDHPLKQRGYLHDRVSRIMGHGTIRQLRVERNTCHTVSKMAAYVHECVGEYSMFSEEKETYGVGWKPLVVNSTTNGTNSGPGYRYNSSSELEGWPYIGKNTVYNGGGYAVDLNGNKAVLMEKLKALRREEWIDRQTRAVFIEFTVYNAHVNLFAICTVLSEFKRSGHIDSSFRVEPMNLLEDQSGGRLVTLAAQIMFIIFLVFTMVKEIRNLIKIRLDYFKELWNYNEMIIIALGWASVAMYVYRGIYANQKTSYFNETKGKGYMKFQFVAYWNELLLYMIGWLCFFASIKFIKLLRFNKRMGLLGATLRISVKPLAWFSVMFFITFLAYCQFFYFVYMDTILNFSTIVYTMETLMQMLVGKFGNFDGMTGNNPVLGPLFFFFYIFSVYYIMIEMFLTIIGNAFDEVRRDLNKQPNEFEMVSFITTRVIDWSGLRKLITKLSPKDDASSKEMKRADKETTSHLEEQINNFPQRMDLLMSYITKMFIEKNSFESAFIDKPGSGKRKLAMMDKQDFPGKNLLREDNVKRGGANDAPGESYYQPPGHVSGGDKSL